METVKMFYRLHAIVFAVATHVLVSVSKSVRNNSLLVHWRHGKTGGRDWFSSEMRQTEFLSICESYDIPRNLISFENAMQSNEEASEILQWVNGFLDIDTAVSVASQSICVRALYDVWAMGEDYQDCARIAECIPSDDIRIARSVGRTWCARVRRFDQGKYGRSMQSPNHSEEHSTLEYFSNLLKKLSGSVQLVNPDYIIFIMTGPFVQEDTQFGTLLAEQISSGFKAYPYSLDKRNFLSSTTMDYEVSFLMANQAQISNGTSVLDPFAGSGGLLLTSAVLGASVTVGIDTNKKIRYKNLNSNFIQLDLPNLTALIHGDMTSVAVQNSALLFNNNNPFDVVLTDPPYGKRENEVGSTNNLLASVDASISLLLICSKPEILRVGGRLVFFVPTASECLDIVPFLPSHSSLQLESALRQPLTGSLSRWLLTYVKVRNTYEGENVKYIAELDSSKGIGYHLSK